MANLPGILRSAALALHGVPGVVSVGRWEPEPRSAGWYLPVTLHHGAQPSDLVPQRTDWHFVVGSEFPWGNVQVFPTTKGISATFHHQRFNGQHRVPTRRSGNLCVQYPGFQLGRFAPGPEPRTEERLAWYAARAVRWLEDAACGSLVQNGHPFELPDFPGAEGHSRTVAFWEDQASLAQWRQGAARHGIASFIAVGSAILASSFKDSAGNEVRRVEWGMPHARTNESAVWMLLDGIPVDPPWGAPASYGDLRRILPAKADLLRTISLVANRNKALLRAGKEGLLLLGFPIPRAFGGPEERIHWQAAQLPVLGSGQRGFRKNDEGFAAYDRTVSLLDGKPVAWMRSENWSPDELAVRGSLQGPWTRGRVAILGVGALGSAVAELLVRGGCRDLVLVDDDRFRAGNAVRHQLTLGDVGDEKVHALARRLSDAGPAVKVLPIDARFPALKDDAAAELAKAEMVLDLTAEDAVLARLGEMPWAPGTRFASFAFGHKARRLFGYLSEIQAFSYERFAEKVGPYVAAEKGSGEELPLEGIGCWHPVFPARQDDVWLWAAVVAKHLERSGTASGFFVYEQNPADGLPGVRLLYVEAP